MLTRTKNKDPMSFISSQLSVVAGVKMYENGWFQNI